MVNMGGRGDFEDNLMILCCASFPCTKYGTITLMFIIVNIRITFHTKFIGAVIN